MRSIEDRSALKLVFLIGLVSMFADMTYEGAWSVAGAYMASLGASGAVVGFVGGFGEFVGQALRLISGRLVDRTRQYWTFTLVGYSANVLAVPLLWFAGTWPAVAAILIVERMGKAVRSPAKDAILSQAASRLGTGFGFGLHQLMDQIGAFAGPLLMAWALAHWGGYRPGFLLLAVPAILAVASLCVARALYPDTASLEVPPRRPLTNFPRTYWLFLAANGLLGAGYADFALISFHIEKTKLFESPSIPLLYSMAMAVDGLSALAMGHWLDDRRLPALTVIALMISATAGLIFLGGNQATVFAGLLIWGLGLGAIGSIVKSTVAELSPGGKRGAAYGYYYTAFGAGWFLGSLLLGTLYDRSLTMMAAASACMELGAAFVFFLAWREDKLQQLG